MDKQRAAGILVFIGVFIFSIAMMVGEALRPAYSMNLNYISDLGAGSNASLFNISIILMGLLVVIAGIMLLDRKKKEAWYVTLVLVGIGAMGVGFFPENVNIHFHTIFATMAFVTGGITALLFSMHKGTALRIISPIVGAAVLVSLYLFSAGIYFGIGPGGMERMIVYPTLFWALALSGHLMNSKE